MYPSTSRQPLLQYDGESEAMEKTELANEAQEARLQGGWGVRHIQAVLTFFGLMVAYVQRLNLSVAVVAMTTSKNYRVDLSPEKKALVLSSLFWGYSLLQIFSGAIGRRGYALKLFAFGNLAAGVFSLAIPFAAMHFGFLGLCILRFSVGLVQGNIYPSMNNVMANWAIPQERDSIMCIVQAGPAVGSLVSISISGYLGYYYDWPSIFYASGLLGIIWGIFHAVVGGESPETSKYITAEERAFMKQSFRAENKEVHEIKVNVPWRRILTSVPVIALTFTNWCSSWCSWTIITLTPTYINGVLHENLQDNGLISALPHLFSFVTTIILSFIARSIKKNTNVPESFLRPFWNSIGMYGNAATLLTLAFAPVTPTLATILLILSSSVSVPCNIGFLVNNLDLSPNFAGVIMSITNSTANIAAILGPLISTNLVQDDSNIYEWRVVFITAAVISCLGNTVFIIWGSTKKQPWDEGDRASTPPV